MGLRGGIVVATDLAVTQNGTPNMSVNVAAGQVFIPGTESTFQGVYAAELRSTLNVAIAAADPTNARKDLIVAKVRDAAYSGASNDFSIVAVTGTPAPSPAEPAVPANARVLAMVSVAAGATSITNANITDRRTQQSGQSGQAAALGGVIICTSTTRPAHSEGRVIYQTDDDTVFVSDGSTWRAPKNLPFWGNTNNYGMKVQRKTEDITAAGTAAELVRTFTFDAAFTAVPVVVCTPETNSSLKGAVRITNITTTAFDAAYGRFDGANIVSGNHVIFHYIAIGA